MTALPKTIRGDELAGLCGLTDRRLRQLAKEGYFKPPVKGMYQTGDALRGIFKSREAKETPASERKIAAEASILERRDRREAGDTMTGDEVYRAWENVIVILRERILRIGNNAQSKAGLNEQQRKVVDQESFDALRELEKKLNYFANEVDEEDEK